MELYEMYYPITSTPGRKNKTYCEYEPCDSLKPYVRCYWGSERPIVQTQPISTTPEIVTPDTCVDIVFNVNFTDNQIDGGFIGIQDTNFIAENDNTIGKRIFSAAIRFYAWGASVFSEYSFKDTKNSYNGVDAYFPKIGKELQSMLYDISDMKQFIEIAESILLKHLNEKHKNETVMQSIYKILENKGNISIKDLQKSIAISDRQLERLFKEYVGVTPKTFTSLVRYQYVWKDIFLHENVKMTDLVYKYGYYDQPHLLHEFEKFHGMNIANAKAYALGNVENIQEIIC